jgi:hypothetical protein
MTAPKPKKPPKPNPKIKPGAWVDPRPEFFVRQGEQVPVTPSR